MWSQGIAVNILALHLSVQRYLSMLLLHMSVFYFLSIEDDYRCFVSKRNFEKSFYCEELFIEMN